MSPPLVEFSPAVGEWFVFKWTSHIVLSPEVICVLFSMAPITHVSWFLAGLAALLWPAPIERAGVGMAVLFGATVIVATIVLYISRQRASQIVAAGSGP
jgi:hypothetical protein